MQIGVQTKNVINDNHPEEGFALLAKAGFSCADFGLNGYLLNQDIYQAKINSFFDQSVQELEMFFFCPQTGGGGDGDHHKPNAHAISCLRAEGRPGDE